MENKTEYILDSIYKSYGSDSGILLGIKDKQVVKAIVEFAVNRCEEIEDTEIKGLRKEIDLLIDALKGMVNDYERERGLLENTNLHQSYHKAKELLNNVK